MEKHFTFPIFECFGFSQDRLYSRSHTGIDMSWWNDKNTPLLAVKSGTIVWSAYTEYGGNVIALEFPYDNTHKQWCLYQHCRDLVKTRKVKQGDVIGNMGNTGHSIGHHLHFTLCEPVELNKEFSYQYAINHTIDPYPHILFRLKGLDYKLNDKPHAKGSGSVDLKKIVEFTNDEETESIEQLRLENAELKAKLKEINKLSA